MSSEKDQPPVDLDALGIPEPTEEEREAWGQRVADIAAGLHPDTGEDLQPEDIEAMTLATEIMAARAYFEARRWTPSFTAADQLERELTGAGTATGQMAAEIRRAVAEHQRLKRVTAQVLEIRAAEQAITAASAYSEAERWRGFAPSTRAADQLFAETMRSLEFERNLVRAQLEHLQRTYTKSGNPLFPWEAFHLAQRHGVPVPKWVIAYLREAAESLMQIQRRIPEDGGPAREAEAVGKALGFGHRGPGRGSAFSEAAQARRDRKIYRTVEERLRGGERIGPICASLAADGKLLLGAETIRKIYLAMKAMLEGK